MANQRKVRHDTPLQVASGVDELIARLKDQGVQQGRAESEKLHSDATAKAEALVQQAQDEAKQILEQARKDVETMKASGKQSLELAFRDTVLALKSQLSNRFAGEVRQLVGEEEQKLEILEKMILEIAGSLRPDVDQSNQVEVVLPRKVAGFEELSQNPEELSKGILTHFVRLTSQGMLREGVNFGIAKDNQAGLSLRLVDRDVVLDLTDHAIANTILAHLQPRFRALLEGVVQ